MKLDRRWVLVDALLGFGRALKTVGASLPRPKMHHTAVVGLGQSSVCEPLNACSQTWVPPHLPSDLVPPAETAGPERSQGTGGRLGRFVPLLGMQPGVCGCVERWGSLVRRPRNTPNARLSATRHGPRAGQTSARLGRHG